MAAASESRAIIENAKGEKLMGILNDTGSTDLCILCHGFLSTKDFFAIKSLSDALCETGISTFRFDFSGNGESEGKLGILNYWEQVEDLRAVILYWRAQGRHVDYIVGHSKGGDTVLLYASKYGDVHKVVNASGRGDLKNGLKSHLGKDYMERIEREGFIIVAHDKHGGFKLTKEDLMQGINTDMLGAARNIPSICSVMTIHGSQDDLVPVEDAYEFDKLIRNHTLKIVEGAEHGYTNHLPELKREVLNFILAGRA